jgi:5-methylcytosine-specific restriction endonuclease McrA
MPLDMDRARNVDMDRSMGRFAKSDTRAYLYAVQDGRCAINPEHLLGDNYHVDHIIRYSEGGPTWIENLQAICVPCHQEKTKTDGNRAKASERLKTG